MSTTRGHYSVSDLLKIDAKGNKTVLPYICLTEALDDSFVKTAKCEFLLDTHRVINLMDWVSNERSLAYILNEVFAMHFNSTKVEKKGSVLIFDSLMFYYLVKIEKSFNCNVKLNFTDSTGLEILLAKETNNLSFLPKYMKTSIKGNSMLSEFIDEVMKIYEYEKLSQELEEVPDSFYQVEMLLHDYLIITSSGIQMETVKQKDEELQQRCDKSDKSALKYKNKVADLENKLKFCDEQNSKEKHLQNELKDQIDALEEEVLTMQKKITSLEYRNKILSLTVSKEEILINEQLIVEENDLIDLSRYNIILCGNDRHLKKYSYKILDYYSGPQRITMLDKADVIAIITTDIEHGAYWAIKNYCKSHGLKFCNINGNTTRVVESSLKDYIRDNLL